MLAATRSKQVVEGMTIELPSYGQALICLFAVLMGLGLVMVASTTMDISQDRYQHPYYYLTRHLFYLWLAVLACYTVRSIPLKYWFIYRWPITLLGFAGVLLVFVPGFKHAVNGSMRWIDLGVVTLQPAEGLKIVLIVYIAAYLTVHHQEVKAKLKGFIKPLIIVGIMAWVLLQQPDFGMLVILVSSAFGLLFLGGAKLVQMLVFCLLGLVGAIMLIINEPYRLQRLTSFRNPWQEEFGSGWQLTKSLLAIGQGELTGSGLGNSVQKLFYLPEAHTDFVFAVLAEEQGFIGVVAVIGLFVILVTLLLRMGRREEKLGRIFPAFLVYGIALLFGIQALINIAVNTGLLPTKGLPLPFLAYGGSNLLVSAILIGITMRVERECHASHLRDDKFWQKIGGKKHGG